MLGDHEVRLGIDFRLETAVLHLKFFPLFLKGFVVFCLGVQVYKDLSFALFFRVQYFRFESAALQVLFTLQLLCLCRPLSLYALVS